jgi:hypothetical protein
MNNEPFHYVFDKNYSDAVDQWRFVSTDDGYGYFLCEHIILNVHKSGGPYVRNTSSIDVDDFRRQRRPEFLEQKYRQLLDAGVIRPAA